METEDSQSLHKAHNNRKNSNFSQTLNRPSSLHTNESKQLKVLRQKAQQEMNLHKPNKTDRAKVKKAGKRQTEKAILDRIQSLNMEKELLMR